MMDPLDSNRSVKVNRITMKNLRNSAEKSMILLRLKSIRQTIRKVGRPLFLSIVRPRICTKIRMFY